MQIQKVNSNQTNQNFNGGLVKISPTHYIDIDMIEGLRAFRGGIYLDIKGEKEGVQLQTVGEITQEFFDRVLENFSNALKRFSGSSKKTYMVNKNHTVRADAIKGLHTEEKRLYFDFIDSIPNVEYSNAKEAQANLLRIAQKLHQQKAPHGGKIVDLLEGIAGHQIT